MVQQPDGTKIWLVKTNQVWKLWIFLLLLALSFVSLLCKWMIVEGIWIPNRVGATEFSVASVVLGFGSLIWLCKSLKCPECGYKPTWPILKSAPASKWNAVLIKLEHCPKCGK